MDTDRWLVAWALAGIALGGASLLVPLYVVARGGGAAALGLLAATAALLGAPGALLVGRLADRTGHRRTYLVASLGLVAVTLLGLPFLSGIWAVIAVNAAVWFAAAAAGPVVTLLATADAPEADWPSRFGLLNRYHGWGWAGGLLLGVVWTSTGARLTTPLFAQRSFFLACGGFAALATLGASRWVPADQRSDPSAERVTRALGRVRRGAGRGALVPLWPSRLYFATRGLHPRAFVRRMTPSLTLYLVAVVLFFTGFAAFFAPLPLFLTAETGFGSGAVFGLYLAAGVVSALLFVPTGELTSRYDPTTLQAGSLATRALAFPAVASIPLLVTDATARTLVAVTGFVVLGATWAVIAVTATTLVTNLAPPAIRGEALGVYAALAAVAGAIGSLTGGTLAQTGFLQAFAVAGGLVALGGGCVLLLRYVGTDETVVPDTAADPDAS